ncbi:MAG: glycosyltransferase [Brumimicrobium sp.]|nr:glycosyltransferase [Brumimicrobium sp.]
MNIVIIGPAYPFRGGLASFNERMAVELQNEGHQVVIYTFTVQYPAFLFPGKTQYSEDPAPTDLKIIRKVNTVNPFNWIKIGREIRKQQPDLVLTRYWLPFMGPSLGTILRCIKRNKKTKIITLLDNIIPHEKRIGDKLLTRYFVKPIDAFVSMASSVQNDLKQFDTVKPRVLTPHPIFDNFGLPVSRVEAAEFLKVDGEAKYMMFFGLIRDYKGLDLLLKAFAQSKAKGSVRLIIAGEYYSNQEQYEKLIDELNLREFVFQYSYFIKNSEVKYFFSITNLVVQPYKDATQSGVTQIAYQFDTPMVVTNVGGLPEMIPDGKIGFVVEPEIDAITQAIDTYFNDDLEQKFRANFEEEKKKYSWTHLSHALLDLYNQIKE